MSTTVTNYPGTGASDNRTGAFAWLNPENIKTLEGGYTRSNASPTQTTYYILATNFGFSIPTSATIKGVFVEVRKFRSNTKLVYDSRVSLVKADTTIGSVNKSTTNEWTSLFIIDSYGSSSDLWGLFLTPADINSINFGMVISAYSNTGGKQRAQPQIDYVRISVTYDIVVATTGNFFELF